jgi:hypothetical protein
VRNGGVALPRLHEDRLMDTTRGPASRSASTAPESRETALLCSEVERVLRVGCPSVARPARSARLVLGRPPFATAGRPAQHIPACCEGNPVSSFYLRPSSRNTPLDPWLAGISADRAEKVMSCADSRTLAGPDAAGLHELPRQ